MSKERFLQPNKRKLIICSESLINFSSFFFLLFLEGKMRESSVNEDFSERYVE